MLRTLSVILLAAVMLGGCATSTAGLTKDQIADRERARAARVNFYARFASGVAVGFLNSFAPQDQTSGFSK